MKAKLIKRYNGEFYLRHTEGEITSHHELSLKNCQAIERGYDLDELVINYLNIFPSRSNDPDRNFVRMGMEEGFKEGFQKALEILGDKKFSEEDMRKAMDRVWDWCEDDKDEDCSSMTELRNKHIQSLQQTEWDVEILEDRDSEGRLILKRV